MAMPKAQLSKWPWNNQPSARHEWKEDRTGGPNGYVAHCQRCGRTFIEKADTRGPVYCYATTAWLAAHPGDDGAQG